MSLAPCALLTRRVNTMWIDRRTRLKQLLTKSKRRCNQKSHLYEVAVEKDILESWSLFCCDAECNYQSTEESVLRVERRVFHEKAAEVVFLPFKPLSSGALVPRDDQCSRSIRASIAELTLKLEHRFPFSGALRSQSNGKRMLLEWSEEITSSNEKFTGINRCMNNKGANWGVRLNGKTWMCIQVNQGNWVIHFILN